MGKANYLKTAGGLSVSGEGRREIYPVGSAKYEKGLELIRNGELELLYDLLWEDQKKIKHYHKQGFRVEDGVVYIKNDALPTTLGEYLVRLADEGFPCEPVLKFWENVNANPSRQSALELFDFLTLYQHPLTEDGCFIGYRRVNTNFKDFHTGKIDNSVGTVVSMPREDVNDDRTQGCSSGLHVANWGYASTFYGGGGGVLLEVKVNPKDVVSVPLECDQQKIRVCKFEVLSVCQEERQDVLTNSVGETYKNVEEDDDDYEDEDNGCDCDLCTGVESEEEEDDEDYDDDDDGTCNVCGWLNCVCDEEDEDEVCSDPNCPICGDGDEDEDEDEDDNEVVENPQYGVTVNIQNLSFVFPPVTTAQV